MTREAAKEFDQMTSATAKSQLSSQNVNKYLAKISKGVVTNNKKATSKTPLMQRNRTTPLLLV